MWMLELFRHLHHKAAIRNSGKPLTLAVQSSRLHAKPISRSKNQSAVASAAYRAGEKLEDKRISETFDYTRKQSVEATRIMAPSPAPDWVMDRATLWNTVEATEKRKDAQLAREVQVAIPDELPKDIREKLVWDFCQDNFVSMGMIADVAIHGPTKENPRNWHWHGMLTMRTIGPDGFGLKERSWNENQHVERWKRNWETACNAALEQIGSSTRVDMRSIEDRHAEQLRFATEATNWIDRMRFEIEAARLDYTARPNLPQKAYRAAAKGEVYPGYEEATAEWTAAIESRGAARNKAMQMEAELEYLLGLTHHDGGVAISAEDKIINRWLADRFEHDPAILAILATIADNTPDLLGSACEAQAFEAFDQLGKNPEDPTHDQMALLEGVGRHILNNGWKQLTHLDHMLRNHDVMWMFNDHPTTEDRPAPEQEAESSVAQDIKTEAAEDKTTPASDDTGPPKSDEPLVPEIAQAAEQTESTEPDPTADKTSNTPAPEDRPKFRKVEDLLMEDAARRAQRAAEQARRNQEAEEFYQETMRTHHSTSETPAAPQETKAEERTRRRAEKAAARARAKLERPISESRKRVLRGRRTINLTKGTLGNLSMGREALDPYPQSQLRRATDTFLSAAKWLTNAWDTYRTGDKREAKFEREEKAYIEASETLAEMHLVVPKPKTMTGDDLLGERARLQELEDFPDQGLVAPVMGTIKRRLKQIVAYLTTSEDGQAKAAQFERQRQVEEAERQRQHEFEQQLIEMHQRERAEQRRRSTINKVRGFLDRALADPEIYDLVVSYGFKEGQNVDEIANDPFWGSVVSGSSRVAWYDLEKRIEAIDAERQRQIDQATLKDLEETLGTIIDRAKHETDPQLSKLIQPLNIHRFRERDDVLTDLRWLEPVSRDEQKRPRWEVVQDRIEQLDAIEKRVKEQREKLAQQKLRKPPSPSNDDGGFSP